jgi:hypothetical protein
MTTFSSNALRFDWRDWAVTACLVLVALLALPYAWVRWERFEPGAAFRMPYSLSDDYFLYARWVERAARQFPVVVVGDSFVWGEYADSTDTLSESLNRTFGKELSANLGLNGLHPAAAQGLVRHYGESLRGKHVLLQFNPLWMQSPELDLSAEAKDERFRAQHPRLLSQFDRGLKNYRAALAERLDAVAQRHIAFLSLRSHMKAAYFDKLSATEWMLKNPYANPFAARDSLRAFIHKSRRAHSEPQSWTEKGILPQAYPWVKLEESYQWRCFLREMDALRSRRNAVFVLLGPFNPHLMTPESLTTYRALRDRMESALKAKGIPYALAPDLPSPSYTDASHVAADGYVTLARVLRNETRFLDWLEHAL